MDWQSVKYGVWQASSTPVGKAPSTPCAQGASGVGPGWHFDGENFLYLDGHAKWLQYQDTNSTPRLDWF